MINIKKSGSLEGLTISKKKKEFNLNVESFSIYHL